jgi:hypothetical protein
MNCGFTKKPEPVTAAEMQLADRVISTGVDGSPDLSLGISTVKQIKDGVVTLFRPYTHTADFSCTSGVICYVGVEEYQLPLSDERRHWLLLQRKQLK